MNRLLLGVLGLLVSFSCFAQSSLPPCPRDRNVFWTNCFGTYTFANGDKYVGEFKENKYHGQGTFTHANGDKYVGGYKEDERSGQGAYTFADGSREIGEYKNDDLNGVGIRYDAKGQITGSGNFENDKLVRSFYVDPSRFANIQASSTRSGVIVLYDSEG